MTPERTLAEVGRALYGRRWKSQLAVQLNVTVRTVHTWCRKAPKASHPAWIKMDRLLNLRAERIIQCSEMVARVV